MAVLLCFALICSFPCALADDAMRSADKIVVLYTNDVHCGIHEDKATLGYADLAQYKQSLSALTKFVTTVDCGDAVQGEAVGTLSKGSYIIDIMNAVGYDVCVPGNHEFDYGLARLMALVGQSNAQYVCCNMVDKTTGDALFQPYVIMDYDGLKIAYVGVVTPGTLTSSSPASFMNDAHEYVIGFAEGDHGANLHAAVQTAVDAARGEGAQYVFALTHLGVEIVEEAYAADYLIANTNGIDAVLDAHSHTVLPGRAVKNNKGEDVLLSSTGTKLANIGQLVLDTKGTATIEDDEITTSLIDRAAYDRVDGVIADIEAGYTDMLNAVVAHTDVALTTRAPSGNRLVRCRETNLGDLCADAMRIVSGADIAFVNGGGVRADIAPGEITNGNLIAVHPFGNMMCVASTTGQQILDALECSYMNVQAESENQDGAVGEDGAFMQVSGIHLTIDTTIPSSVVMDDAGMFVKVDGARRVKDVTVLNGATGEFVPIDPEARYSLASFNFIIKQSGSGINMFAKDELIQDETILDNQVLIDYITEYLGGRVGEQYAQPAGRITVE